MAMYALAISPLIQRLKDMKPDIKQIWFADDATAAKSWGHYYNGGNTSQQLGWQLDTTQLPAIPT